MSEEAEVEVIETTDTAPEQKEEVEFNEEQQKVFNDGMAGKAFEVREEKRRSAELQRQLEEFKANVPKEARPDVQGTGDIYDEDYESARTAREGQIREQATFDARQAFQNEQVQQNQLVEQQKQQAAYQESLTEYGNRAAKIGITPQELQQAGTTVSQNGLRQDVINFLIADTDGPVMTRYLSENLVDVDSVNRMNPMQAGVFMNDIREKAKALYTKTPSGAPPPADTLNGSGIVPQKRGVGGTKFE